MRYTTKKTKRRKGPMTEAECDTTLQELVLCAQVAEDAMQYDTMANTMDMIVRMKKFEPLNREERRLLCSAWRNVTMRLRKVYKVIKNSMNKTEIKTDDILPDMLKNHLDEVRERLSSLCQGFLKILDEKLLPSVENQEQQTLYILESRTFYMKIKADNFRYLASISTTDKKKSYTELALKAYREATIASQKLDVTSVVRLELALNFAVFYCTIMNSPNMAIEVAKDAYDQSVAKLETVDDKDEYRGAIEMMKLLRDNLRSWASTDLLGADMDDAN